MKVLLRDDVDGVGRRGDIVKVAGGFARNFLLPEGRAIMATDGVEGQAEQMRRGRDLREAKSRGEAESQATILAGAVIPDLGEGRRRRSALRFDRSRRRGGGHPRPQGCGDRPQARAPARAHQGSGLLRRHRGVVHGRCNSGNSGGHGRFLSGEPLEDPRRCHTLGRPWWSADRSSCSSTGDLRLSTTASWVFGVQSPACCSGSPQLIERRVGGPWSKPLMTPAPARCVRHPPLRAVAGSPRTTSKQRSPSSARCCSRTMRPR